GNFKLGHGYCDFAGSGVVHSVGGLTAFAVAMIIGPRIGKFNRDGSPNAIPGHDITMVLLGCFILAFGWFGFNPGSTLGVSGAGNLRIGSIAVNTMLAGCTGSFGALLYMWMRFGKPDASMSGNGLLAGLVAITAPGLFYGDAVQFLAQVIGMCTLVGVIFTLSYVFNVIIDVFVGQRVSTDVEHEGLDLPEMGALGYPEFQLVTPGLGRSIEIGG